MGSARRIRLVVALSLVGTACSERGPLARLFRPDSPYEAYLHNLRSAGLEQSALGREWAAASQRAMASPISTRLPFRETGYFAPHSPTAVAYQLELRRGRRLQIEVGFQSLEPGRLFVDLFSLPEGDSAYRVTSLPADSTLLSYRIRRDGKYLLRLQPELLRGGRYTLTQRTEASVLFPVPGLGIPAMQSRFGATRDAGRRTHQGVDIFARKGTPVVAVTAGQAYASTNELGGNVVWLRDAEGGPTYYYAHLDRWAIDNQRVKVGDTLGFIGNTGNARTTPAHLHFGVYEGGPSDPYPFLAPDDPIPAAPAAPAERLGEWLRVSAARSVLRAGPASDSDTLRVLLEGDLARAAGVSRRVYRVQLPDETVGYLDAASVTAATTALRREQVNSGVLLLEHPSDGASGVGVMDSAVAAEVLGRFREFILLRLPDAREAWIRGELLAVAQRKTQP